MRLLLNVGDICLCAEVRKKIIKVLARHQTTVLSAGGALPASSRSISRATVGAGAYPYPALQSNLRKCPQKKSKMRLPPNVGDICLCGEVRKKIKKVSALHQTTVLSAGGTLRASPRSISRATVGAGAYPNSL